MAAEVQSECDQRQRVWIRRISEAMMATVYLLLSGPDVVFVVRLTKKSRRPAGSLTSDLCGRRRVSDLLSDQDDRSSLSCSNWVLWSEVGVSFDS